MKVPPMVWPRFTALANELMLKCSMEVLVVTHVCPLNSFDWSKGRKTYLTKQGMEGKK